MHLTPIPQNSPLTILRQQGFDADFSRCRLRVGPKPKMTKAICDFITTNLVSIVDELNQEAYYTKNPDPLGYLAGGYKGSALNASILMWRIPNEIRAELGGHEVDFRDTIHDADNGEIHFQTI